MSFFARAKALAWRALQALFRLLLVLVKIFFVLLMLVIPVPLFMKPQITNAYRRNQVTQVEKKRVPD